MAFGARSFNGATDVVDCGNGMADATSAVSGAAWIYPTAFTNAYNGIISRSGGSAPHDGYHQILTKSNGKVAAFVRAAGAVKGSDGGTATLSANTFYHVAYTFDTASGEITYVNGAVDSTFSSGGDTIDSNTGIFTIGNTQTASQNFPGRIADAAVWNVVLTAAEIAALAQGIRPLKIRPASIIGYWPNDGINSPEPDLSGFRNNGTVTGTINAAGPPLMPLTRRRPQAFAVASQASYLNFNMPMMGI